MSHYENVVKPTLNVLCHTNQKDLAALKTAIDAAATAGASRQEIVENVGGTQKWNQIIRKFKKAGLV